jgi:putative phosphoribosyl transferase
MPFRNRAAAGRRLASRLLHVRDEQPVVLALPRGGVPVAYEVARALDAPLDVILVRKLGVPSQPELAMGALGEGGVRVLNRDVLRTARVPAEQIARVEARERAELERRARTFRGQRPMTPIDGRSVIVIDDGIATGSTALAALQVARARGARRVVLAAPVAPPETVRFLAGDAAGAPDEIVILEQPDRMWAIGSWYVDFAQTTDAEVVALLERARYPSGDG